MLRGSVLLAALLINARVIWQALADQSVSLESATIHFLITVPIVAVLFGLVRMASSRPRRRPRGAQGGPQSQPQTRPVDTS
jgi:hypothetical protein